MNWAEGRCSVHSSISFELEVEGTSLLPELPLPQYTGRGGGEGGEPGVEVWLCDGDYQHNESN